MGPEERPEIVALSSLAFNVVSFQGFPNCKPLAMVSEWTFFAFHCAQNVYSYDCFSFHRCEGFPRVE